MDVQKLYISTIDPNARFIARKYDLGLEIADFCYAYNMDEGFCQMDALVRKKLEGIRRRLFHGPFSELFPCAIDLKARALAADRFRQAIFLAAGYGAKNIVLHGGFLPYGYFPQWYVEQSILFWKGFLADMPEDVSIFLENVLEPEPEMLRDIVEAVGDARLGLCLDIGHANVYGKRSLEDWLSCCDPYLKHVHIHNNDGTRDTHGDLMTGTIPIKPFLDRLREECPEATVTLEISEAEASVEWLLEA